VAWRVRHRDGTWRQFEVVNASLLDHDAVRGVVATLRDVTERRALERELEHQAFHDRLTGLANRALFRDRLEHALARRNRNQHPVAVLLLDLDDFKVVNDSLGHAVGDRLLVMVADRLRGRLRASDTTARLGGDEFAVLLDEPAAADEATRVAERLIEALAAPYQLDGRELFGRASIGVALAARTGQPPDELLRDADMAMYAAKARSRGGYQIFQPELHQAALGRLALEADLQRGSRRASSRFATSRSWSSPAAGWRGWRRCCAGGTRSAGGWRRWTSSQPPRPAARSCPSGASCYARRAARRWRGRRGSRRGPRG